ncbi:MAG: pantoate--beta-alanine ligase [Bacteroidetes bacterium]|nr:MAG: pantoate--beta-alanine ligase [Bacteroidota bacterium]
MLIVSTVPELHRALADHRAVGRSVGFVPTMGFLHEGHLSLVRRARQENGAVVVSIFVNPAQFAPTEDLDRYPRDVERDSALCRAEGCDILFVPKPEEMYPDGFSTYVSVEGLSSRLEGTFRPTHFRGVATVVLKLFLLVRPDRAYFGQKDAQQCAVIAAMVRDLAVPVRLVVVPTVRESDGLAMSSRNVYLSPDERKRAPVLYRALSRAAERIAAGERDAARLSAGITAAIMEQSPSAVDYAAVVDPLTLEPVDALAPGSDVLIPVAVRFGTTRLIDNIIVRVP